MMPGPYLLAKSTPDHAPDGPLGAALDYVRRGWRVFPTYGISAGRCDCGQAACASPGKHPLIENGCKGATTNPTVIRGWSHRWPNANVGIATGPESDLLVIDLDGADAIARFRSRFGHPACLQVRTSRGVHLYYTYPVTASPISNSAGRLGPKMDVRGAGGYVNAPPSWHKDGMRYEWLPRGSGMTTEMGPACPALITALVALQAPPDPGPVPRLHLRPSDPSGVARRVAAYLARVGGRGEGSRNTTAYQIAAWLTHDMALGDDDAWPWLTSWNRGCRPPLTERELAAVLRSAVRTATRAIGAGRERARSAPSPQATLTERLAPLHGRGIRWGAAS
jgi:Bifunctional DNA primase/polymerase, N-terminal